MSLYIDYYYSDCEGYDPSTHGQCCGVQRLPQCLGCGAEVDPDDGSYHFAGTKHNGPRSECAECAIYAAREAEEVVETTTAIASHHSTAPDSGGNNEAAGTNTVAQNADSHSLLPAPVANAPTSPVADGGCWIIVLITFCFSLHL